MKTRECLRRGMRLLELGIKKATSYNMVKGRLNYRWSNDEYIQSKLKEEEKSTVA